MTQRNRTNYPKQPSKEPVRRNNFWSPFDTKATDKELRKIWERARERGECQLLGVYDKLKKPAKFPSMNCEDVLAALDFMFLATSDENFKNAAKAMRTLKLTKGGVKQKAQAYAVRRSAAWTGARKMHFLIVKGMTKDYAAKLVAAHWGITAVASTTFEAAVENLKNCYDLLSKEIAAL